MYDKSLTSSSLSISRRRLFRLISGRRSPVPREILKFVFLLFIMILSNPARAAEIPLQDVLPAQGIYPGWVIEGKVKLFDKDTLFDHINGEAELYFPYGFEMLATANYINEKNQELSIVADVYKMASVLDAFGIYSNYRKPNNLWITIGAEGFVSGSQLMFYQDRYFVRLQVSGETSLSKEIFMAMARAISGKLPAGVGRPKELEILNIPALMPHSERYLAKSLLGYVFFHTGLIADAQWQNEKMQIFAIQENTPADARRTFDQYYSYLKAEAQGIRITENKDRVQLGAVDPLYGGVQVVQSGRYVVGVVRIKNDSLAGELLDQLHKRINADGSR
jgi:hypothetical protein